MINFKEYDDRTDQYVADEIKKRRLAKQVVNATDDYKMKKTKPAFTFPHHTGSTTIHVYLRKMSSGVVAYNYDLKFDEGSHQRKVAQDDDVEDRDGTQPAKYYKGVKSKSTKQARARHFEKGAKMDDDNPAAYKPAPGDKSAKTKPSKHTLKYKKMFGEDSLPIGVEDLNEKIKGLVKKAEKSGISYGILKKVYDRGMAAWRTGHRPGTTPQQWAFARVNSFITGGGARKADADLWKKRK